MYNFYPDSTFKKLYYTETKNCFSEYLIELKKSNQFDFNEVFLDHTFGPGDNRNKILPNICKAINNGESSPIENPNNFINLIFINDLIDELIELMHLSGDKVFNLYSNKVTRLVSIYNFLFHYKNTANIETDLIETKSCNYNDLNIHKKIIDFDIKNFTNFLIKTLDNSKS